MRSGMHRRTFLAGSAALGLGALGCSGDDAETPGTSGGAWGVPGTDPQHALLSQISAPESVLDIFLLGGLCPWDTFYVVPEHGDPAKGGEYAGTQWWTFQDEGEETPAVSKAFADCGGGDLPMYEPWGLDSAGKQVNLGPFIYPLRQRPDLLKRMRVYIMSHDVAPHEGAIPLAISGHGVGTLRMCSPGAHFERFHRGRQEAGRTAPYSYVISQPSASSNENFEVATLTGLHGASVRPLAVQLGPDMQLVKRLYRVGLGDDAAAFDRVVARYLDRYRSRLRFHGDGSAVRAPTFSDFAAARSSISAAPALTNVLSPDAMQASEVSSCGLDSALDYPGTALRLAAHLLNHTHQPARHITVMEGGLKPWVFGQGYDSHEHHVVRSSENVVHFFKRFVEQVNEPGENDPTKLDLDRQMVCISSEFGRSPAPEFSKLYPKGTGLAHWPAGYVVMVFGGFVNEGNSGVIGSIDEAGVGVDYLTPAEHRAAIMLASGIWPFSNESFRVSDVRDAKNELEAALILKERFMGVSS